MTKSTQRFTERENRVAEALREHRTVSGAARAAGMERCDIRRVCQQIEKKTGWNPLTYQSEAIIPEGQRQTKTTVQYDAAGNVIQEWRRLRPEQAFAEDFVEALQQAARGRGKVPKRRARKTDTEDLCFELAVYDLHAGMYADKRETGDAHYDTDIALRRFHAATDDLLAQAQRPDTARLILGGDQIHADNFAAVTPASGHALDVDGRYSRTIRKLRAATTDVVAQLAEIARQVEIYVVWGNHDPVGSLWLAQVLDAYYEQAENITVSTQDTPRKVAEWGQCMSLYAHGDRIAASKWAQIAAAEYPALWGRTRYRYALLGHIHHNKTIAPVTVQDQAGIKITYLLSLAATDSYHAESGYVGADKGMQAFTLHRHHGRKGHHEYHIEPEE